MEIKNSKDTRPSRILICSAWPYGSGIPHLGNLIGCLLSGGALTSYYRLRGYETLHVSGTDAHGTRIEYEAARIKVSPAKLVEQIHSQILAIIKAFDIAIDNYTTTESPVHKEFVVDIYRKMDANGYITTAEEERVFCTLCNSFLADRFIIGRCPKCGNERAKGNQCDACGLMLEPEELSDAKCSFCGKGMIVRKRTRHWYLDLVKLSPKLREYIASRNFRSNVNLFAEQMIEDGLRPRAITRDLEWGIPAPFVGAEGKVIYVWAEAALGYLSATIEYFRNEGQEDKWRKFWFGDDVKQVYTQGKDNIPFHVIIFPAQLIASGEGYHLPDQIAASEYLNWTGGERFSKSEGKGIYADEAIKLLDPEYWRFYLLYERPETQDVNFSWAELDRVINGILIDNISNLINRVLSFITRNYDGIVPSGDLDSKVAERVKVATMEYERAMEEGSIAAAARIVASLAVFGNEYFQQQRPWQTKDPQGVIAGFHLVKAIAVLLQPFIPRFATVILTRMGASKNRWDEINMIAGGRKISSEAFLLAKIDVIELERRYNEMKNRVG
ncbi:methionine--tRNA ligase [Candidatus Acetothermia bacterium]|jgi:methionyl-tRNA synthetase|nr:methionine--tRNA ligase [Candidatus Acetothermia bacterium]MCI2427208.1 methionine--tRNA ligase [Candidatus Acetothermia bacterium]MCI2428596.1 methionine--tRNA ligase [Candidatus Acetothermia bacterium]